MSTTEDIKQKLDIVDVVGSYVTLNKAGRNYKGVCPFHSENTPSFMVSRELQIFKCFGCGESGDIFGFVQKVEGIDFFESLKRLADKAGVELPKNTLNKEATKKKVLYEINLESAKFYNFILTKHKAGISGLNYLKNDRGLSDQTIKKFLLGYAPDTWDIQTRYLLKKGFDPLQLVAAGVSAHKKSGSGLIDKFRGRVMFPLVASDGNIVGFTGRTIFNVDPKYLNTAETDVFHKNGYVYALDKAKISLKKLGAVFVEGQMDVIAAHQAGFTNVIASSGTSLTKGQLQLISRYTKDISFCFDTDQAGLSATHRAILLAEAEGFNVRAIVIPEKYKDLDELISGDKVLAQKVFENSIDVFDFYFVSALKRHDMKSSIGKKKIFEELVPIFSKISNKVTLDHYTQKLSDDLGVDENVVREMLAKPNKSFLTVFEESVKPTSVVLESQKITPGYFILAAMMRLNSDSLRQITEKLSQDDFSTDNLKLLFNELQKFLSNNPDFDIQRFIAIIDTNLQDLVREMFLRDLGDTSGKPEIFLKEINTAIARVKKTTIKRELSELTEKIKLAEVEKNQRQLEKLLSEYKALSSQLTNL